MESLFRAAALAQADFTAAAAGAGATAVTPDDGDGTIEDSGLARFDFCLVGPPMGGRVPLLLLESEIRWLWRVFNCGMLDDPLRPSAGAVFGGVVELRPRSFLRGGSVDTNLAKREAWGEVSALRCIAKACIFFRD
jgi:hypothetical protein